jgi:hypothetical protein
MPAVKDAYRTTTGNVAVRDEAGKVWVLKREHLSASMNENEQLEKAIDLFIEGSTSAFESYYSDRHGLLHV